jgi:hypothetical protein
LASSRLGDFALNPCLVVDCISPNYFSSQKGIIIVKLHHLISYGLLSAGAVASLKALLARWQWEENNVLAAIMLDWDDVQAVATRSTAGAGPLDVTALLEQYQKNGATYLSIPELTLKRLLARGELSLEQGSDPHKVYLRAQTAGLAALVSGELQARLPHLGAIHSQAKQPLITFSGDLPTVAEVGLGFNPAHAELADRTGLAPLPRPIGYSWVQAAMIERSLAQAATLGAKLVAFQGDLVPGHEFNMQTTIETLQHHGLKCAYFSESRHQRGDWHLVKNLTQAGLVVPAHEFAPAELLEEDWHTLSARWANLAIEAGIRLCSLRFFRVIHAGDPLESVTYVRTLAQALQAVALVPGQVGRVDLTPFHPKPEPQTLAGLGLGAAGAAGLAADLLPLPDPVKLLGLGLAALSLGSLPFVEQAKSQAGQDHPHDHDHHDHHHHHQDDDDDDNAHDHDHHHHDHNHGHSHGPAMATAYASKGIALATAVAYPLAAIATNGAGPVAAAGRALALGTAGAAALGATTADIDYALGIEPYRAYHLDWLLPLGLAAGSAWLDRSQPGRASPWRWLPLVGLALAGLKNVGGPDPLPRLDREHRHSHTHHLSAFQRLAGDGKMALAPKPLRKWAALAPLGAVGAALFKRKGRDDLAAAALTVAAAGQVATLAGFRNAQRPVLKTTEGRVRGWAIGLIVAALLWLVASLSDRSRP